LVRKPGAGDSPSRTTTFVERKETRLRWEEKGEISETIQMHRSPFGSCSLLSILRSRTVQGSKKKRSSKS